MEQGAASNGPTTKSSRGAADGAALAVVVGVAKTEVVVTVLVANSKFKGAAHSFEQYHAERKLMNRIAP